MAACPQGCANAAGARGARDNADGFTLIEIMVAMVILAIALAAVSKPLMAAFSTASHTRSVENAQADVLRAHDRLQADLLNTRSPNRNTSRQRGVDSLTEALLVSPRGGAVSDDPADRGRTYDVYDVIAATPTMLRLVADVDSRAGTECVQWDAANTAATGRIRVTRSVFPNTTCTGAAMSRDVMIPDQPWIATSSTDTRARVPAVFSYQSVCSSAGQFCAGRFGSAGGACGGWTSAAQAGSGLNTIVGVTLNLRSINLTSNSAGAAQSSALITIPSREAADYRRALGCG